MKMLNAHEKHFLITTGRTKEIIDGVRFITNNRRSNEDGYHLAESLAAQGAKITLISTEKTAKPAPNITIITTTPDNKPILSAQDLLDTCDHYLKKEIIHEIFHLANVSSIKPTTSFNKKLKIKNKSTDQLFLEVTANIDFITHFKNNYPHIKIYHENKFKKEPIKVSLEKINGNDTLANKKIIITSGPTVEQLTQAHDVLTNFSSGKQGHAIACALAAMGANVILVSGPTNLSIPEDLPITIIPVTSANEMKEACFQHLPADVFIGVAAVADFYLPSPLDIKLQENETMTLSLSQNPDILSAIGNHSTLRPKIVIGFAAETHDLLTYAKNKLLTKNADAICANIVGPSTLLSNSNQNKIHYITRNHVEELPEMNKLQIGFFLGNKIADFFKYL